MMAANGVQETVGMSRSSTGLSNGAPSDFEVISHPSSGGSQTPISLSQINPLGMSQMPSSMTDITLEQALARVHDLSRENNELRDYLKDNNEMMKKQYESLAAWKKKVHDANVTNREKFEQTKALIIGLRKDNEELLEKVRELETNKQEKENELLTKIQSLESARLQSEQLASQVRKQAEEQGMSMDDLDLTLRETVVVSVSAETEEKISHLEREIEYKNNKIHKLKEDMSQLNLQLGQFRGSTDQLLKDLEGQQKLKEEMQRENQELHEKNLDLNLQVQGFLSDTRHSLQLLERNPATSSRSQSSAESAQSHKMEAEVQEASRLVEHYQKNEEKFKSEMASLRSSFDGEKNKCEQLQARLNETAHKLTQAIQHHEQEKAMLMKKHEQTLMELARQQDTEKEQQLQSATYDSDIQSLRSQVLTLISEVHETQTKLAAATDALDIKNKRLKDMEEKNGKFQMDLNQQRYEFQAMLQSQQHRCALMEQTYSQERHSHDATKRQMGELQRSFEQLVGDYKELLDTFDQYKLQQEAQAQVSGPMGKQPVSEQINHLTAQVMAAEEALTMRDEQIQAMKDELKNQKREYDDMAAVFKAQADVYKADFDAERHAREQQVTDKERILTEMGDLQVQNQRLIDELESYSKKQISEMQRRVAHPPLAYLQVGNPGGPYGPPPVPGPFNFPGSMPDTPPHHGGSYPDIQHHHQAQPPLQGSNAAQHDEEDVPLVCPQCNLTCPDMDTLQIHVIECLDQDEMRRANAGN